jgi:hypothetical protein
LAEGVVIQLCTSDVMSIVTNCPAIDAGKLAAGVLLIDGMVAYVTVDSDQAPVISETFTEPVVFTRFRKSVTLAEAICEAVMPAGRPERSNWMSAVSSLPTYRFDI